SSVGGQLEFRGSRVAAQEPDAFLAKAQRPKGNKCVFGVLCGLARNRNFRDPQICSGVGGECQIRAKPVAGQERETIRCQCELMMFCERLFGLSMLLGYPEIEA